MKKNDIFLKLTYMGLIIAIIATIPVFYFLYDRYFRGKIVVEYSDDNIIAVPIYGIKKTKFDGALTLIFNDLNIKNLTNLTKTIKEIEMKYEFDNKEYKIIATVLPVSNDALKRSAILLAQNKGDTLVMQDWKDIRVEIYKYKPLLPEGILNGSVSFIFYNLKMEDYKKITNVKFMTSDSKNKVYKQKFDLKDKYLISYKKGFRLIWKNQ